MKIYCKMKIEPKDFICPGHDAKLQEISDFIGINNDGSALWCSCNEGDFGYYFEHQACQTLTKIEELYAKTN